MVVAWALSAIVLPGVVAASGHDALALVLLVVVVPLAGALRLRVIDGASSGRALRVTSGVMLSGLVLLFLEYWATGERSSVDGSQVLGLAAAAFTGAAVSVAGSAAGGWLHRWTTRRAVTQRASANAVAAPSAPLEDVGRECPACGLCHAAGTLRCAVDGSAVRLMAAPLTLAGRYHLVRRLGRGGMGTVYEAHDETLDRPVAIKLVHDDLFDLAGARPRTDREARAAARFNHPHVVTVFDYGTRDGVDYIVMERLVGHSLRDQLRRDERLAPAHAFAILRDVASAVDAAHRQHWLHLDLKPENVFLVRDAAGNRAKVLDFGLAQWLGLQPPATAGAEAAALAAPVIAPLDAPLVAPLIGTPAYMAPERLRGDALDPAVDLWSLAVMAFEMLTGGLPFAAATVQADVFSALPSPPVRTPAHLLPAGTRACFARALAIDRAVRPRSAGDLVDHLERSWHA